MSDLDGTSMVRQNPLRVMAPEEALEFETLKEVQVVISFVVVSILQGWDVIA